MNALLITPRIYDFTAFNYWLYPLIELITADYLIKAGYDVTYINGLEYAPPRKNDLYGKSPLAYTECPKPESIKNVPKIFKIFGKDIQTYTDEISKAPKADIVIVFQKMTYWYMGVLEAVDIAKKYHPDAELIIGGNLAELLNDFYQKKNLNLKIAGSFDTLKSFLKISQDISVESLIPRHELFLEKKNPNFISTITTFGCPFKCPYCINSIKENKLVYRKPDDVSDEVIFVMNKYNIRDVAFYDDYVISNKNITEILRNVKERFFDARFHFPNGLPVSKLVQYLGDFKKMSVKTFALGFEFQGCSKSSDKEYVTLFDEIKKLGFDKKDIGINIMIGLPEQKYSEVLKTIDFVQAHSGDYKIKFNEYSPIPGTQAANIHTNEVTVDFMEEPLWQNNSLLGFRGNNEFSHLKIEKLKSIINRV